ncbi:hypothetical protein K7X08_002960 [Anisodus acutangulus]|uniref:Cytochrome P450 n=1 Tax=Anisodus acutangulus TaxID=402998 RepID=A0A9Q1MDA6_9SOLA|nr:hypothetical protein K7X08_002960 [Anisodus acutangulus]
MLSHGGLAHRSLASAAWTHKAKQLMAFSLGSTPVVVSSDPQIAKEILTSPHFADRPIKQSAKSLMFSRTIEFAPNGTYWRLSQNGTVSLRKHLQLAALNNIMGSVFGKRYNIIVNRKDLAELQDLVQEGFHLLGAFNWSNYLPWLSFFYDPSGIVGRCEALVPRVQKLVKSIIDEHMHRTAASKMVSDNADFVDVLLSHDGEEKLG